MSRTRRALSVTVLTTVFVLTGCSVDAVSASPGPVVTSVAQTTSPSASGRGDIRVTR